MGLPRIELPHRRGPFSLPWPVQGNPSGFIQFDYADQRHTFITSLDIDAGVPDAVRLKYARAQKLYWLGWISDARWHVPLRVSERPRLR